MTDEAFEKALNDEWGDVNLYGNPDIDVDRRNAQAAARWGREYGQREARGELSAASIGQQSTLNQLEELTAKLRTQQSDAMALVKRVDDLENSESVELAKKLAPIGNWLARIFGEAA